MFISKSEEETRDFGQNMAKQLREKDVVFIYGELGAGKTCLVKGIVEGLGLTDEYVRSPTFTIINKYIGKKPVYHLDFYRIESVEEIEELGIEEFSGREGVTLIEWPEKILKYIPQAHCEIKINILGENKRSLKVNFLR
tara:strand:- start:40 stop:456 length:417 start_codon:yes stop_codon:yes gene_type:complete